jgi:hypothetical protein
MFILLADLAMIALMTRHFEHRHHVMFLFNVAHPFARLAPFEPDHYTEAAFYVHECCT